MVGQIIEIATASVPSWALDCDGATHLNDDYPELAAVIAPGLVVDGTHFRTPDRVERFGLSGVTVGDQGGEQTHTLNTGELPSHQHSYVSTSLAGSVTLALGSDYTPDTIQADTTGNTGGGSAHNNMPPWEGTRYVIVAKSHG